MHARPEARIAQGAQMEAIRHEGGIDGLAAIHRSEKAGAAVHKVHLVVLQCELSQLRVDSESDVCETTWGSTPQRQSCLGSSCRGQGRAWRMQAALITMSGATPKHLLVWVLQKFVHFNLTGLSAAG